MSVRNGVVLTVFVVICSNFEIDFNSKHSNLKENISPNLHNGKEETKHLMLLLQHTSLQH